MEKKTPSDGGSFTVRLDEDCSDEIVHQPFENRKKRKLPRLPGLPKLSFGGFQKTELALIVLGAVLFILIILFVLFLPGKSQKQEALQLSRFESRLQAVEEKFARLELLEQQLGIVAEQSRDFGPFMERYERLEAAASLKTDHLARQLNDLRKQMSQQVKVLEKQIGGIKARSAAAAKKRTAETDKANKTKTATTPSKTAVSRTAERTYTVRKGDTVYSISRRYGVSVEDLKRLNKLSSQLLIHSGQKLRIPAARAN